MNPNTFYFKHIIKGNSNLAYLIVFGPIFICFLLLFFVLPFFRLHPIYSGLFYPILFILSKVIWIEQSLGHLVNQIPNGSQYKSNLNQLRTAKWSLFILETWIIPIILFQSELGQYIEYPIFRFIYLGSSILLMPMMFFSFYVYIVSGNWLGKALVESEVNRGIKPEDSYLGISRISRWLPKKFKRLHKRIRKAVL